MLTDTLNVLEKQLGKYRRERQIELNNENGRFDDMNEKHKYL